MNNNVITLSKNINTFCDPRNDSQSISMHYSHASVIVRQQSQCFDALLIFKRYANERKLTQKDVRMLQFICAPNFCRVRITDCHCRHLRRKIKFGTKNHKLAKTSGEKISPESPTIEPYNCRTCLSRLP